MIDDIDEQVYFDYAVRGLKKFNEDINNFCKYTGLLELNQVHNEWAQWLFSPHDRKTVRQLAAHRESYKTTVMAVCIARLLLTNHNIRIGIIRSNKEESKSMLGMIRTILISEPYTSLLVMLGLLLPGNNLFSIDNKDRLTFSTRTKVFKEGTIDAMGYTQSIVGRHYDILILDDFVTIEDRLSSTIRNKKWILVNEIIANVLTADGIAFNTCTFWHNDDANQRFKHAYTGDKSLTFQERIYPIGSVFGESKEELEAFKASKIKGLGQSLFAANYLLENKQDENAPFSDMQFEKFIKNIDGPIIASIDPGYGGDSTAVAIGTKGADGKLYVIGKLFKESMYDIVGQVTSLLTLHEVTKVFVETNADKGATANLIDNGIVGEVIKYAASTNKEYRIMAELKPRWDRVYFDLDNSDKPFLIEVAEWNGYAAHDDAPDALAKLLRELDLTVINISPDTWG